MSKIADGLLSKAVSLLTACERAGDLRAALVGVGQARETLLAIARLEGLLEPQQTNVAIGVNTGDGTTTVRITLPLKIGGHAAGETIYDPSGTHRIGRTLEGGAYELFAVTIDPNDVPPGGGTIVSLPSNGRESFVSGND